MSKLLDMMRAAGIRNSHDFYAGEGDAGRLYLLYLPTTHGRGAQTGRWQVIHRDHKTDPDGHFTDHGHKSFLIGYAGIGGAGRVAALTEAQEWAAERYGITAWKRDPFGSYGDAAFVTARTAELQALAIERGFDPDALEVFSWRGFRSAARVDGNRHAQTSEILAAKTKAEVKRIAGLTSTAMREISTTSNKTQVEAALKHPGVVLWAPIDGPERDTYRLADSGAVIA